MLAFVLGREKGFSLAEIAAVFPRASFVAVTDQLALVSGVEEEEASASFFRMGGIIKIIRCDQASPDKKTFAPYVLDSMKRKRLSGKNSYAIAQYHADLDVFAQGISIKGLFKKQGQTDEEVYSLRLVNKINQNINSAVYKKERLYEKEMEFNICKIDKNYYFWPTIAYQDVDEYSARDTGKIRDMQIGMLPPKLAQIMCNLAQIKTTQCLYDPFVGLGTVLIEAAYAGYPQLLGSDISAQMVSVSRENVEKFLKPYQQVTTLLLDATRINTLPSLLSGRGIEARDITIVSEGYLGNILSHATFQSFSIDRERESLMQMYQQFFSWLKTVGGCRKIVMTFPFWEIGRKRFFLEELPNLLYRAGWEIDDILPRTFVTRNEFVTKRGSLLYRRPGQFVGREMYVLVRR